MSTIAARAAGLFAGVLLIAGGCGGDDATSAAPSSPPRPTTSHGATPPLTTPATPAPEPRAGAGAVAAAPSPPMSPPTSALADMGDPLEPGPFAGIDAPTTRDYCAWALHADALFKRWMELARTPAENEAYLVRLQPTWEQMRLVAPGDLDSRFDIVTPTYEFIWESLADSGFDLEVHHAEHGDDILALRDQTFLAAAHTIDTYGYDTCGVTPP